MHCMPTFSFYWQIKASVLLFFYSRICRWWHSAAYYFCKYDDGEEEELGRRWGWKSSPGRIDISSPARFFPSSPPLGQHHRPHSANHIWINLAQKRDIPRRLPCPAKCCTLLSFGIFSDILLWQPPSDIALQCSCGQNSDLVTGLNIRIPRFYPTNASTFTNGNVGKLPRK